jgi:hypothetical protein
VKSDGRGKQQTGNSECQFGTAVSTVSHIWGLDKHRGRQENLKLHENEYTPDNRL